jgi:hypothetical protein
VLNVGGRTSVRWVGLVAVAALALAGCASLDGKVDGKVNGQTQGKAVSGRELNAKVREAVAKKPSVTVHLAGNTIGNGADGVLRMGQDYAMSFEMRPTGTATAAMKMLVVPQGYFVSAGTKVDGKEWVRLIGDRIDPISAMLGGTVQAVQGTVELDNLERQLLVAKDVREIGTETVGAVKATHYRMSMDKASIKTQVPPSLPADQAQSLVDAAAGTIDLYLAPEGLPVKVVNTVKFAKGTGTSTVTYEKWGEPVNVPQPVASEVLDLGNDHDLNALNKFLAKVTGQDPDTTPSMPAQP